MHNFKTMIIDLGSYQKITQFKKDNGSNRSLDVGDIADLKSMIFSELCDGGKIAMRI